MGEGILKGLFGRKWAKIPDRDLELAEHFNDEDPNDDFVAHQNRLKSSERVAKLATAGSALFLIYGVFITGKYLQALDDVRTEVLLMTFQSQDAQMVRVTQGDLEQDTVDLLMESYLTTYVTKAEEIDHVTFDSRKEFVRSYTQKDWFDLWVSEFDPSSNPRKEHGGKNWARIYQEKEQTRQIQVESLAKLPEQENTYQADIIAIDRHLGREVRRSHWRIIFKAERGTMEVPASMKAINPLAITVSEYARKERL